MHAWDKMKASIRKIIKSTLVFVLNFYFHSDEKSMAFVRRILNKECCDLCFAREKELETILSTVVQDEYDFSRVKAASKVVVFFEIAPFRMCGGQMSLFSYCKYSKQVLGESAEVLMTTIPGPYTYCHNDRFENDIDICRWEQVRVLLKGKKECILHIPEADLVNPENGEELVRKALLGDDFDLLRSIENLQINIVNQQIELMPSPEKYRWLYSLTNNVTTTVCNKASATQNICNEIGTPLHMLSVYYDLGNVKRIPVKKKAKLILLSPDVPPQGIRCKVKLIEKLNKELPDYKVSIIRDLTFQECMRLTAVSVAVITFGEGFDGYLNNSPQVGTLAFAVYNNVFFPDKKWKYFPNIYDSYDEMLENIVGDIMRLIKDENLYNETVARHEKAVLDLYVFDEYIENLKRFYAGSFDFRPNTKKENRK